MLRPHDRIRNGLYWKGLNRPRPSWKICIHTIAVILAILLGYYVVALNDLKAGLLDAQARQIKTEVLLIRLLNGEVLEDKGNGLAMTASILVIEEKDLLKGIRK